MKRILSILIIVFVYYNSNSQSIDYETQIAPIFNNSCMPCHGGSNPSSGLDLTSYENVMAGSNTGLVVIPGDVENSLLWQEVNSGDMPNNIANNNLGIADLNDEELQLISDWILDLQCMVILCEEGYTCMLGECVCINDEDGDTICDEFDNCPDNYNPNQEDADNDGIGNDCDPMPLSIDEFSSHKEIINVFNLSGQESQIKNQNTLIYIYKDGSIKKTWQLE